MRRVTLFSLPPPPPGLTHIEVTVGALVEVIHAFTITNPENVSLAAKLYMQMLLSQVSTVGTSTNVCSLTKLLRQRVECYIGHLIKLSGFT